MGVEERCAGVGGRFTAGGEIGHVDIKLPQDARHFVDDAGAIIAGDRHHHLMGRFGGGGPFGKTDGEAGQQGQRFAQAAVVLLGHGHMEDAGKLACQLAHGTAQPVALLATDDGSQTLDDTWFVCTDHGDHQLLLHPALLGIGFLARSPLCLLWLVI